MNTYTKGIIFTFLSAVIFGFTPILVRISYNGGANGVTVAFLRAYLALPFLYYLVRRRGISLRLSLKEFKTILLLGCIGSAATTLTLYMSYNYISVGMATTLHFIYPLLVSVGCVLFLHQKLLLYQKTSLVLGCAGIFLFMDFQTTGGMEGIFLALLSGVCYAFYISYMSSSGIHDMYFFKLSFYLCLVMGTVCGLFGLAAGKLTLDMTGTAWLFVLVISLLTSVGAISLLQLGIRLTGPSTAAILSTLEPITSVILGILILHEELSLLKLLGCILILSSVAVITFNQSGG